MKRSRRCWTPVIRPSAPGELLPALPKGVTSSYIQYLDAIEQLEREGVRVKVSDISDALHLPRPGVTRTVGEMEDKGYLQKSASAEDGRVTYLTITEQGRKLSQTFNEQFSPSSRRFSTIFPTRTRRAPSAPFRRFTTSWPKGGSPLSTDRSDFTQGSILKKLSLFMLPVLGALILQAAYGAVDLLVGRPGSARRRASPPFRPAARS